MVVDRLGLLIVDSLHGQERCRAQHVEQLKLAKLTDSRHVGEFVDSYSGSRMAMD